MQIVFIIEAKLGLRVYYNGSIAERNKSVGYLLKCRNSGVYENVLAITIVIMVAPRPATTTSTPTFTPHTEYASRSLSLLYTTDGYIQKCVNTIGNFYADVAHVYLSSTLFQKGVKRSKSQKSY